MSFLYKYILRFFAYLSFLSVFIFTACKDEEMVDPGNESFGDDVIKISASVGEVSQTRGKYIAEGIINEGTYYLYIRNDYNGGYSYFTRADVNFGHPENPTLGYATYESNGKIKEYKWSDIINKSQFLLFLNNVDPAYVSSYGGNNYTLSLRSTGTTLSPYVISPLDTINGSNDLQSCQISCKLNDKVVEAHMVHVMSLARVNIKVYAAEDGHMVDLSRAKVYITNITPRLSGIYLKGTSYQITGSKQNMEMVTDETEWNLNKVEVKPTEDKEGYDFYSTVDFVLPPQTLGTGSSHPRLVVEVPMEDVTGSDSHVGQIQTYSNDLPGVMFLEDLNTADENNLGAAYELKFISGNRLNITAVINSPETELYFAPVTVQNWTNKNSHNVTCDQSGIYSPDDFYEMIRAYQDKDISRMLRYGYMLEDGTYVFQMWGSISLDKNLIENKMSPDPNYPFIFRFNDNTITVIDENESEEKLSGNFGQTDLYNIVTGEETITPGIENTEEMEIVATGIKNNDFTELASYGVYYEYMDRWVFEIKDSFTFPIDDIFNISGSAFTSEIEFNYNGNTVTLEFGDGIDRDKKDFVLSERNYPSLLSRLIKFTPGINDPDDFYLLKNFYNNYYTYYNDILDLFGTQSVNANTGVKTWKFNFLKNMTLRGDEVFLSMRPDGAEKPGYSIDSNTTAIITLTGDDFSEAYALKNNTTTFYKFLSGTGAITYSQMTSLITYYNSKSIPSLWQLGYYDNDNNEWVFTFDITYTGYSENYNSIFGGMVADPSNGLPNFSFVLGRGFTLKINNIGGTSNSETLRGAEGLQTLYEIVTGTYVYNP